MTGARAPRGRWSRGIALQMWTIVALAVAGIVIYVVVDHWTHMAAAAPYVGIIAIAAMHLFGHRGHGGHRHGGYSRRHIEQNDQASWPDGPQKSPEDPQ